jgi:flagellar operon protein (TIGR03826 family)
MDVRNCKGCGKLFNYIGGPPLCQACRDKLEKKFQEVRDYLWENPKATIAEITTNIEDVSSHQIKQWIREERLQLSSDSPISLYCENCGKKIVTGRYCQDCKNKMAKGLNDEFGLTKHTAAPEKRSFSKENDKMRFFKS